MREDGEEVVAAWKKARTQRKRFSKWRRTYGALEDLIKGLPCYKQQPKAGEELNTMFDEAIKRIGPLLPDPGKYKRRFQSLSQGTVYNDLVKKRKLDKAGAAAAGALTTQLYNRGYEQCCGCNHPIDSS